MTVNPPHDSQDPLGHLNAIEAAWLASKDGGIACPHCQVTKRMLPMTGNGWGVEVFHELHCPDHDNNAPEPERPR